MRIRFFSICIVALVLIAVSGCNTLSRQPKITQATINPQPLHPGQSAVITLAVRDKHRIVERIEGVVLEDPRATFKLRDDGEAPDEKAGDSIWSMQVDVPFQAPPGEFQLEFTAFDKDGTAIMVRNEEKRVTPLQEVVLVRIEYQEQ